MGVIGGGEVVREHAQKRGRGVRRAEGKVVRRNAWKEISSDGRMSGRPPHAFMVKIWTMMMTGVL